MCENTDGRRGEVGGVPQAPRQISIETADKDSAVGRNDKPYNEGCCGMGARHTLEGDPEKRN